MYSGIKTEISWKAIKEIILDCIIGMTLIDNKDRLGTNIFLVILKVYDRYILKRVWYYFMVKIRPLHFLNLIFIFFPGLNPPPHPQTKNIYCSYQRILLYFF